MKKFTLLRAYDRFGLDVSFLYDPNNVLDTQKKQKQEDWLDSVPIAEIANEIDKRIAEIRHNCIEDDLGLGFQAGDGALELIESLKKTPEVGIPMYGNLINTITMGARLRKFYLRSSPTGTGKALTNSTIIPTPNGDKRVDEIKVGDYLFDAFGKPTQVLGVYPQGEKEVWEITFKDGRKAKCCDEHLWSYCTVGQKNKARINRKFYTSTLKELQEKELYSKSQGYKILVPMQKPVEYTEKSYYIKPYSFGLLLGDGSFRYNSSQKALYYSSEDEELPNKIAQEMNWDVVKNSEFNYNWTFKWKEESKKTHINVWVEEALKDFPGLWNIKSEDKFIPSIYLEGSIEQRFELLNGLLDSDGCIHKDKGRVSYATISKQLKNDVTKLARGLGFKVTIYKDTHKETNLCYVLEISGPPEEKAKLFKLKRKKEIVLEWLNNNKRKERNLFNPIISIQNLHYKENMTCFYVDNEEHLFLMNDFIVTHNTRSLIADACNFACSKIWNEQFGWVKNGTAEPTLFIATEQDKSEVQTMMLAFLSDVNERHILMGRYDKGEEERVIEAAKILKESPLYVEQLPDFSMQDVENKIKHYIREKNVLYICYDYLHSSLKILEEVSKSTNGIRLREDNVLFMISAKLKDIANIYGVFIISSTQLSGDFKNSDSPDQTLLRGSKAIADKIDVGLLLLAVT